MQMWIAFSSVAGLILMAAVVLLVRQKAMSSRNLPVTAEWIDELSIERYRPMMRLLDGGDLEFLRSQPGFTPGMATKLRTQRCQIFRGYLRCLNTDFARVCAAIKLVMMQSKHDRPDLASALLRNQLLFAAGIAAIQCRLLLYRWGVCGVDVTSVVKIFDLMRLELRSLVPAQAMLGA